MKALTLCTMLLLMSVSSFRGPQKIMQGRKYLVTMKSQAVRDQKSDLPLSLVVGNEEIKSALLLAAVNPRMGGVIISGRRGTAKSVMARGLYRVMPPIEIVKDSPFNIDPDGNEIDSFLERKLQDDEQTLDDLEREVVPCPFVQVPLNVLEDRLIGSVDVEKSVQEGRTIFEPGLLARAHRGILYVDEINLLDTELCNIILSALSDGYVVVEREGISVRYPCRPILVATFNPDEGELRDHLLDRIAVAMSVDNNPLSLEQRIEAVGNVMSFGNSKLTAEEVENAKELEDQLQTRIIFAREYLKGIELTHSQLLYLCEEASRAGCQGQRAEIFAAEVAQASAALEDRAVSADDLRLAVKLAILPRSTFINQPDMEDAESPMPPPPPPPPPSSEQQDDDNAEQEDQDDEEREEPDEPEDQEEQSEPEEEQPSLPQEFMFDAEGVVIDPELLRFAGKQRSGKTGQRALIFSQDRGRYIKPMLPRGKAKRLAVDATLRAAAPYQKGRRIRAQGTEKEGRRVLIEEGDLRVKKMARKAGSLVIFAVDASGSMALNRMNAAKGAAMSLLTEAYQSRDKVSLIVFQGERAEALLPPTRSIAMAKRRLETMPCGGGSPLAHALEVAVNTGINAMKSGDIGKVVVVLVTDGRANVNLDRSRDAADELKDTTAGEEGTEGEQPKVDRAFLKEEVLAVAKQFQALSGFNLVVLDTENKFVSTGFAKEIAQAGGGKYHYIPKATESAMAKVAGEAISSMKA